MTAGHDECDSRMVLETVSGSYMFVITNFTGAQSRGVGQRGVRGWALFELRLEDQNWNGSHRVFTRFHHPLVKGPHTLMYRENMRGYPRFLKRDDPEALHYIKDDRLILHCIVGVVKAKVEGPRHYRVAISPSIVDQGLKASLNFGLGTDIYFLKCLKSGSLQAPGEHLPFGLLDCRLGRNGSNTVGQRPDRETMDDKEDVVLEGLCKFLEKIILGSSLQLA